MKNCYGGGEFPKKVTYGVIQKNYLHWGGLPKGGEGGHKKRGIFERGKNSFIKKININIFLSTNSPLNLLINVAGSKIFSI